MHDLQKIHPEIIREFGRAYKMRHKKRRCNRCASYNPQLPTTRTGQPVKGFEQNMGPAHLLLVRVDAPHAAVVLAGEVADVPHRAGARVSDLCKGGDIPENGKSEFRDFILVIPVYFGLF